MSSVSVIPQAAACPACGSQECDCAAALADLDARARVLVRDGFHAAGERRLHHAARQLGEAVRLGGGDASSRAVLGLCRLALGDAAGARAAWLGAGTDVCATWARSLEGGELRRALAAYDRGLARARAGDHPAALAALDEALGTVPELVPAARLRGLVLLARGDAPGAREAWRAQLALCRDDPELLRLLAESAEAAGPALPGAPRTRRVRLGSFAAGAGSAAAAAALAAMLAWPAGAPPVSPAALRPSSAPAGAPSAPPSAAPASAVAAEWPSGWAAYREGRDAHARGEWAGAARALEASVAAGEGRFYHDDALYLLARSLARAGRAEEARRAAARLVDEYPTSDFHNRAVRSIAATGAEPAS